MDETRRHPEQYFSPALSPLPHGDNFSGSIFRGFPKMQERCPICDLKFAREAGYFVGAMYISYGIALLVITLIAALLWAVTGWWITKDVIWAVICSTVRPTITLLPGVLWIYLDQTLDPEMQ